MNDLKAARLIAEKMDLLRGKVYFVVGYVRDEILSIENKDIEVHGIGVPEIESILDSVGERLEYGKGFGIYGLRGLDLDIALPRTECVTGSGHRDFTTSSDTFMGTYEAAKRRNLTVNALMKMCSQARSLTIS
jgi:tRNA nucleotidyltransferase/poly(A) polymerase